MDSWVGFSIQFNFLKTGLVDFSPPKTPILVFSELIENLVFGVRVKKKCGSSGTGTRAGQIEGLPRYPLDQRDA